MFTPTLPPWQPGDSACDVYEAEFASLGALPFGLVPWYDPAAGWALYDEHNPTKRGLVFEYGKIGDGQMVFIGFPGTEFYWEYIFHPNNGGNPYCQSMPDPEIEQPQVDPGVPATLTPAQQCAAAPQFFGVARGQDALYFGADCDPLVQIFVDGVLMFEKPDFGMERVRVPAAWESRIEIWVESVLWGYFEPNSNQLHRG